MNFARPLLLAFITTCLSLTSYSQYTAWQFQQSVNINNTSNSDLANYQVLITLTVNDLVSTGKLNANFSDLRFAFDCDGNSPLTYYVEGQNSSNELLVWALIPALTANTDTNVFMFFGNSTAVSESNFDIVFPIARRLIVPSDSTVDLATLDSDAYDWVEVSGTLNNGDVNDNPFIINTRRIKVSGKVNLDNRGASSGSGRGKDGYGGTGAGNGGDGGRSDKTIGTGLSQNSASSPDISVGFWGGNGLDAQGFAPTGFGGFGGGALQINAAAITIDQSANFTANGQNGEEAPTGAGGITVGVSVGNQAVNGGGGGSGGGFLFSAFYTEAKGSFSANGGNGGNTTLANGAGGGGAGGRVKIFASKGSISITSDLKGGLMGISKDSLALPGEDGTVYTSTSTPTTLNPEITLGNVLPRTVELSFNGNANLWCEGTELIATSSTGLANYTFFQNNTEVQNSTIETYTTNTYSNNDNYSVTAVTPEGCQLFSDTIEIIFADTVLADFTSAQDNGTEYTFTNSSANAQTYLWNFGDGTTSTDESPSHTFPAPGAYDITLIAFGPCENDTLIRYSEAIDCDVASASFTSTKLSAYEYSFTNSSTGNTFEWDFGDGNTSQDFSPNHTFTNSGAVTVRLIVSTVCNRDTAYETIAVNCTPPSAQFSVSNDGMKAEFKNNSTDFDSYIWDFGNGLTTTSNENPTHIYTDTINYTVTLSVSSTCGTSVSTNTFSSVCPATNHVSFDKFENGLDITFYNRSNVGGSFLWDFKDGNTSTTVSPKHTYQEINTYDVNLSLSTVCIATSLDTSKEVTATCVFPVDFAYEQVDGYIFRFSHTLNNIYGEKWDLDNHVSYTGETIDINLGSEGTHTMCFTAFGECGSITLCKDIEVICPRPEVDFTYSVDNNIVSFTNTSSNGEFTNWKMGDGTTLTDSNITYTYEESGEYKVCLTYQNSCGFNQFCNTITIDCPVVKPTFSYETDGNKITFLVDSTAGIVSFFWDLGDGTNSTSESVTHTYNTNFDESYYVCLTAITNCGKELRFCDLIQINCLPYAIDFSPDFVNDSTVAIKTIGNVGSNLVWDLGDGSFADDVDSITHTYPYIDTVTYTICLYSENLCGGNLEKCKDYTITPSSTVGIKVTTNTAFNFYPNPTKNTLFFAEKITGYFIIINSQGKEVLSQSGSMTKLDLGMLNSGIYLLKISTNESVSFHKIIKE